MIFTIGQAVPTIDNDQVKPAGKYYVNASVCMCCSNVVINKKHKVICVYINIYIYIYTLQYII